MPWYKQIIEFKPIDLALIVSGLAFVIWFFVNRLYQKRDNLFNKEGFPAGPFRTDSWKGITEASKFKIE